MDLFAICVVADMPGPRNMRAVRGVSSYKFAYSNKKVVCSDPNILWLYPKKLYKLPRHPPMTLICFDALAEFKNTSLSSLKTSKVNRTLPGGDKVGRHAVHTRP